MIDPGEELHGRISDQLDSADIILLLVSADSIDSDYCYDVELTRALERHNQGEARVILVILRPCDWHRAPFGTLRTIPPDGKPIIKHQTPDESFLEVAQAIRQVVDTTNCWGHTANSLETVAVGTYSQSMSVSDDGYTLFLEPLGMARFSQDNDGALTMEGAAEYFWSLFVEQLR